MPYKDDQRQKDYQREYKREYMRLRRAGLSTRGVVTTPLQPVTTLLQPVVSSSLQPVTTLLQPESDTMLQPVTTEVVSVLQPDELLQPPYIYIGNSYINNIKDVNREGEYEGKPEKEKLKKEKRITVIDDEFIAKMHERWDEKLSAVEVDDQIELAQAHMNFKKWDGKQAYVNNWLKRQAEGGNNGRTGKTQGRGSLLSGERVAGWNNN